MEETLKQRVLWQRIKKICVCTTVVFLSFMDLGFALWYFCGDFYFLFCFGFLPL